MIHDKVESTKWSAQFAKKREEVNDGDIVTIVAPAEEGDDQYNPNKKQKAIRVRIERVGERMVSLSQTTINILIDEFGSKDDTKWVGKKAKVLLRPTVIGGKKVIVLYLTGMDWVLDEYGSPVNPKMEGVQPEKDDGIPVINQDEKEIRIEAVPF